MTYSTTCYKVIKANKKQYQVIEKALVIDGEELSPEKVIFVTDFKESAIYYADEMQAEIDWLIC